jgi:hypothetical protein
VRFEYKVELPADDGQPAETVVLLLRPLHQLPVGVLRKNRHDTEAQMWDTLEWGCSDQLDVFDRVPQSELQNIIEAWHDWDGVSVGKSTESSTSSTDTGTPSKPTSSATDSD